MMQLVSATRAFIDDLHRPDGFNIGFNDGVAAGQTVDQLHLHVIPRYVGDVDDPRGGVRHVIPSRGNYLHQTPKS
jgi:diadenosine tetraphosphate (Ap4A) HIT family hydrolase